MTGAAQYGGFLESVQKNGLEGRTECPADQVRHRLGHRVIARERILRTHRAELLFDRCESMMRATKVTEDREIETLPGSGKKSDVARPRGWEAAAVAPLCCVRRGSPQTWQETNLFERKRAEICVKRRLRVEASTEADRHAPLRPLSSPIQQCSSFCEII